MKCIACGNENQSLLKTTTRDWVYLGLILAVLNASAIASFLVGVDEGKKEAIKLTVSTNVMELALPTTRCARNDYPMATKCLDCHNEKELIKSWSDNNYLRVLRTYQATNYDQFAMKDGKMVTPVITTQQVIGYLEQGKEVIVMEVAK